MRGSLAGRTSRFGFNASLFTFIVKVAKCSSETAVEIALPLRCKGTVVHLHRRKANCGFGMYQRKWIVKHFSFLI